MFIVIGKIVSINSLKYKFKTVQKNHFVKSYASYLIQLNIIEDTRSKICKHRWEASLIESHLT